MGGKGGGGGTSMDVDVDSESSATVDIVGLDDINADVNSTITLNLPQPLRTEGSNVIELKPVEADLDLDTTTRLTIDPLKTDSSVSVDLKPAVVDLCLTVNVGKLPNVCVRQPYSHHVGITLFGYEVWGISVSGEQQTVIEELDRRPQVAWGGATAVWPSAGPRPAPPERPSRDAGGLRVRLGP
jgi:hypothetical protein